MTDNNITADIRIFLGPKGTTHPYRLEVVASTHRYGVCTELLTEMRQWCTDHIGHEVWARHSYVDGQQLGMTIFAFTSPDAVMMFKMRWC